MGSIRGADTNLIVKKGTTHGTAVQGGAGDKLVLGIDGSLDFDLAPTILEHGGVGSGQSMKKNTYKVGEKPTISISQMTAGYDNNFVKLLALLFGSSPAPTEQTTGEGDYKHTITYDSTVNKFATIAGQLTTSEVIEFPSCYATSATLTAEGGNGFLVGDFEFVADKKVTASTVNTTSSLGSATVASESLAIFNQGDAFRLNAQAGGALAGGDIKPITGITIELTDAKDSVAEIKGVDENGEPSRTELFNARLTVNFRDLKDFTYYSAYDAGTEYKADFSVQGTAIGAGLNEQIKLNFPRLKVVEQPAYSLASAGINPSSVTFEGLVAVSNPTGMTSTKPYLEVINERSTAYL